MDIYFSSLHLLVLCFFLLFFFNDTATTEIYTLSLHDALPISAASSRRAGPGPAAARGSFPAPPARPPRRSEEHTSELQSRRDLVCRLLLEKKKKKRDKYHEPYRERPINNSTHIHAYYRELESG